MDVTVQTHIERPRAEVAAYLFDPGHDPQWMPALNEVRWLTEPPLQVGTRVARVARFLGKSMEYVLEVLALEPERRLEMRSTSGPFPMTVTYELTDQGGGTLFKLRTQGDARGFYKLAAPLLKLQVEGQIRGDLARLKARLES